jgi:hypothetical protein
MVGVLPAVRAPLGFPRSALSSGDWGGGLLDSGVGVSLQTTCGHRLPLQPGVLLLPQPCRRYQSSGPATAIYGASAEIPLRSPVQSFPGPANVEDSRSPWAVTLASDPALTANAWRAGEQARDPNLEAVFYATSLDECDLVSHPHSLKFPLIKSSTP